MRMNLRIAHRLGRLARSFSYNKKAGIMELSVCGLEQSSWRWHRIEPSPLLELGMRNNSALPVAERTRQPDLCYGYSSTAML